MTPLAAMLFDVDGTLADTERAHLDAFNRAFADAGLDWHWSVSVYKELLAVTGGKERIRYYIDRYLPGFTTPAEADSLIAALHATKTQFYLETLHRGTLGLRSGVARLLREARESRIRLAIATTTTPANVTVLLERSLGTGAPGWFEVIAAGDMVPRKKPAPDVYQYVLEHLGASAEECVAFEDSAGGLCAARAAGLTTIVATNEFTREQNFQGAELVLDLFGEPGQPFKVLHGDVNGNSYLNVDLVRKVLARAQSRASGA